ncbi:hypothetical protein AAKU55_004173 [Oxalobacteraceae bacterium GrIS 1.11]
MKNISRTALYLSAAIATLCLTMGAAQAASVGADMSYDPMGMTYLTTLTGPVSATRTDPASVVLFPNDMTDANGRYPFQIGTSARADANGTMALDVYHMSSNGSVKASTSWMETINNQSLNGQRYQLGVNLDKMDFAIEAWKWAAPFSPSALHPGQGGEYRTGYAADVLVDGVSVWHSSQTFKIVGTDTTISKEGFNIGNATTTEEFDGTSFSLNPYHGMVDLGSVAAGSSAHVTYSLSTFSYLDRSNGCYGDCQTITTHVSDPASIGGSRISLISAVPEPESYAMLLGGLGLLGFMARRRKAKQAA